jgi:hypothetical protein
MMRKHTSLNRTHQKIISNINEAPVSLRVVTFISMIQTIITPVQMIRIWVCLHFLIEGFEFMAEMCNRLENLTIAITN